MELYTSSGLCVQRVEASADNAAQASLGPTEGPVLVALYRLFMRLHHTGDPTITRRGTQALQGTMASRDNSDDPDISSARADPAQEHVWSLSAAGAGGGALGAATAMHAMYPFFLLPQPTRAATRQAWSRPQDQDPLGSTGRVAYDGVAANTNGSAKAVDDIPVLLSLSEVHGGARQRDGTEARSATERGDVVQAAHPLLQLQSTQRVWECAPVPIAAAPEPASTRARPADTAIPSLLLCCTCSPCDAPH